MKKNEIKCTHPDHIDGVSCEDRAVGCHPECVCCMGQGARNSKAEGTDSCFKAGTGMLGATEAGQKVTPENVHELPPGSVVRLMDGSRIIHLHDGFWLWCCDHAWTYGRVEDMQSRLKGEEAELCHIPVPQPATKYGVVMQAEMKPDMYAENGPRPMWNAYCEGDKQDDTSAEPLKLDPNFFPAGTKVEVKEPVCPECDEVASICDCGFDWNEWAEVEYS